MKQIINIGTVDNDGTGDTIRAGGDKINGNFDELYATSATTNEKAAMVGTIPPSAQNKFVTQGSIITFTYFV